MYSVSDAYKAAIASENRTTRITGSIVLSDATVLSLSDDDIAAGSLYISEQLMGSNIEIGAVTASELGVGLSTPPEDIYSLDGARIELTYELLTEAGW